MTKKRDDKTFFCHSEQASETSEVKNPCKLRRNLKVDFAE